MPEGSPSASHATGLALEQPKGNTLFASMNRAAAAVATLALMGGAGILAATATAGAATDACVNVTGTYAGYCGSEVNMYSNAWNVKGQAAATGTHIDAYPNSTTDPANDLIAIQTTTNPNERVFFYAPNGVKTGFVVVDPAGGYPGDSADGLILKPYTNSPFQQFTGVNTTNTAGTQWTNVATKLVVTPNGTKNQLTGKTAAVAAGSLGSYWGWNQPGVVPAG